MTSTLQSSLFIVTLAVLRVIPFWWSHTMNIHGVMTWKDFRITSLCTAHQLIFPQWGKLMLCFGPFVFVSKTSSWRNSRIADGLYTITLRWRHFEVNAIHGLTPHYLCNDVSMIVDVHGYNTRSSENMNLYVPKYTKEICKRSFAYKRSMLWNDLPDEVKESSSLDTFKSNYRFYIG